MGSMKVCSKCGESKPLTEFHNSTALKDNLFYACKPCILEQVRDYYKTKRGVVARIYNNQIMNSNDRGHDRPEYTLNELYDWILDNDDFSRIYDRWFEAGDIKIKPSIDRLDDSIGYSFENIQVIEWQDNYRKRHQQMRDGLIDNPFNKIRAVVRLTKEGEYTDIYISTREAERITNTNHANISKACREKHRIVNGTYWRYLEDMELIKAVV